MSLSDLINQDIKKAMLSREKDRLEALRSVKAAFMLARTDKGAGSELTQEEEHKIVQKLAKQRKDSAQIYKEQGRDDLFQKEAFEYDVISNYLPAQMSEEELKIYLQNLVNEMGANSMQQMGQVMARATGELSGKADGKLISAIVRELLN